MPYEIVPGVTAALAAAAEAGVSLTQRGRRAQRRLRHAAGGRGRSAERLGEERRGRRYRGDLHGGGRGRGHHRGAARGRRAARACRCWSWRTRRCRSAPRSPHARRTAAHFRSMASTGPRSSCSVRCLPRRWQRRGRFRRAAALQDGVTITRTIVTAGARVEPVCFRKWSDPPPVRLLLAICRTGGR